MSWYRAVFIYCDSCGQEPDDFGKTLAEVRRIARVNQGWSVRGGKDLCARCLSASATDTGEPTDGTH